MPARNTTVCGECGAGCGRPGIEAAGAVRQVVAVDRRPPTAAAGRPAAGINRGGSRAVVGAVALGAVIALLAMGCAPEQRYRTLSFFFDGVPRPGEEVTEVEDATSRTDFVASHQAQREARLAAEAERAKTLKAYAHGPYASKNCAACHATGAEAAEMFIPGRGGRGHMAAFGPKLRLPRNQICGYCHVDFRPEQLTAAYRHTHGPVAAGACLRCHSPHVTPNPFMVIKSPIRALCLDCHRDTDIYSRPYHPREEERDCIDCHQPHGGDRQYFLRPGIPAAPPAGDGVGAPEPASQAVPESAGDSVQARGGEALG